MKSWHPLLIVLFSSLLTAGLNAGTSCSEDVVCIHSMNQGGQTIMFVEIKKAAPITIEVQFHLENAMIRWQNKSLESYNKAGKYPLATIKAKNPAKGWRYRYKYNWVHGSLYANHNHSHIYHLPLLIDRPVGVTQGFGGKFSHQGDQYFAIDLNVPVNTPIAAARGGVVMAVKEDSNIGGPYLRFAKHGNYILILHDDLTYAAYYHLRQSGALVQVGQKVAQGQLIGYSGNTGFSTEPHLHFAVHSALNGKEKRSHRFQIKAGDQIISEFSAGDTIPGQGVK